MSKAKDKPSEAVATILAVKHPIVKCLSAGVPIVAVETADPAATIASIVAAVDSNGSANSRSIMQWDLVRALAGINKLGESLVKKIAPGGPTDTSNPVEMLDKLRTNATDGTVVFIHNAHKLLISEGVLQGIWNLRDVYKMAQSVVILLGPSFELPEELKNDVIVISEPAPTEEEIRIVVGSVSKDAGIKVDEELMPKVVDRLLGYPALFPVEQNFALSLTKSGPDLEKLWDLRVANFKTVAGMEILKPKTTFNNVCGVNGAKSLLRMIINGRRRPKVICLLDEVEKSLAASTSDLSGTTQAVLEQFLFWTASDNIDAMLLTGIPGTGKTVTAMATAGEADCVFIRASLSMVKGSLVGETERNMKAMIRAINSISQGNLLLLATSNNPDLLPPEVMARFKLAQFFYDLLTDEELVALWQYYMAKYGLTGNPPPNTQKWVGREVESCCYRAWVFGVPLEEAARTVVPIHVAQAGKIDNIRKAANGRYLSAANPGPYVYEPMAKLATGSTRTIKI